jgi:uncharacterized membrane protein
MPDIEKVTKGAAQTAKRVANGDGPLGKPAGLAIAGAALAAAPFAVEKLTRLGAPKVAGKAGELADQAKEKATSQLKDVAEDVVPDSPGKLLGGGALKRVFGGGEDDDGDGRAAPGYGSGRRMPIQQAVDVAVPLKTVYNHWTEYETWPEFMHRIENAEQVDDATVSFQAKIWGISKRFEADIVEQRPDERIEWNVTQGYAHTGVVTFHALSDNLTRVDLTIDIQPSNVIDKASRGMRFVKRGVRGDLHRFKAWVELDKESRRGNRKTIEDGKVKRSRSSSSRSRSGSRSSSSSSRSGSRSSSSSSRSRSRSSGSNRKASTSKSKTS